jgi:hypothetical protein
LDFFKPDGGMDKVSIHTPHAKGKKKDKKIVINAFMISIGDNYKMSYTIEEDTKTYNYNLIMNSGDAFVISSDVMGI